MMEGCHPHLKGQALFLCLLQLRLQLLQLVCMRGLRRLQVSRRGLRAALRFGRRLLRRAKLRSERCGLLCQARGL